MWEPTCWVTEAPSPPVLSSRDFIRPTTKRANKTGKALVVNLSRNFAIKSPRRHATLEINLGKCTGFVYAVFYFVCLPGDFLEFLSDGSRHETRCRRGAPEANNHSRSRPASILPRASKPRHHSSTHCFSSPPQMNREKAEGTTGNDTFR